MSTSLPLEEARRQFPALREKVFLDAACVSIAPRCAIDAVQQFLNLALQHPSPSVTVSSNEAQYILI